MNSIRNPKIERLDYRKMRKECYHRNLNPQNADNQFKEKYGFLPPLAWTSNCFFSHKRKMSAASQLKFARYCLRHTNSADEAIEMMQIEVGFGARWDEYKRNFLTCVREWESRVSPKIESFHASQGWQYKKFDIYHPAIEKPHHENIEDNDIYTLNDLVKAWESLSEEEQKEEKEWVTQSLLGKNSTQAQKRRQKVNQQTNARQNAGARKDARSANQQQKRYQHKYSRYGYGEKSTKIRPHVAFPQARFLKEKYQTIAELKTAYRKLSKKLHPDIGGNDQDFRELLAEYEKLKSQF